jgi:hypothetical protein
VGRRPYVDSKIARPYAQRAKNVAAINQDKESRGTRRCADGLVQGGSA